MYKVEFNPDTGRLKSITNLKSGLSAMVDQQFFWYNSSTGNNINSSQVIRLMYIVVCVYLCIVLLFTC